MSESNQPADKMPPDERPIPDPLSRVPSELTESEAIEVAGGSTLSDELPGRASATDEDLTSLFANPNDDHLKDGFAGSGDEDGNRDEHLSQNDGDLPAA
jgi:hypothetical protein